MKIILLIITIALTSGCTSVKGKIQSYGVVKNKIIKTEINNNLIAGETHIIDTWNLIKRTTNIKNIIGTEFGIAYTISAPVHKKYVAVEEIIIFPGKGLTNPETGKTVKIESEFFKIVPSDEQYFTYSIDNIWESKAGTWVFQVKQGDTVLLEKSFNVQ